MMYAPVSQLATQERLSRDFRLNLYLTNPYWDKVEFRTGSTSGSRNSFQYEYSKHLGELRIVTMAIAAMIGIDSTDEHEVYKNAEAIAGDLMKCDVS
jgi:hypothetical protein